MMLCTVTSVHTVPWYKNAINMSTPPPYMTYTGDISVGEALSPDGCRLSFIPSISSDFAFIEYSFSFFKKLFSLMASL